MAFIKETTINGKTYYSLVKSAREGDKVKHKTLEYYGRMDPRQVKNSKKAEPVPFSRVVIKNVYCAGPFLCLFKLMREYGICNYIDTVIPKRQGIPSGLTLFLIALHKLFGFNPSLNNLNEWLEDSPLKINDDLNVMRFNCDNVNYIFDKLFQMHGAVQELENVQAQLFHIAKETFAINEKQLYYDMTSTYFEGNACEEAEFGYSRDYRGDKKQIAVGLVATRDRRFPVFTKVFQGNMSDKATLIEVVTSMKYIYNFRDIVAILDRGMTSEHNLTVLDANEYDYIIGASATAKVIKKILLGTSSKRIKRDGVRSYTKKRVEIHSLALTKELFRKRRRIVIIYNESRARDQIERMHKKIEQARAVFDAHPHSLTPSRIKEITELGKSFVTITLKGKKHVFELNKEAISNEKKKAGKSALITTMHEQPDWIVQEYFMKDIVEKIFRFTKQYGTLRPIRRYISQRVKIDVFLSFLSYYIIAFIRELLLEKDITITHEQLIAQLPQIRLIVKQDNTQKQTAYQITANTPLQEKIIEALDLSEMITSPKKVCTTSPKTSSES